MALVAFRLLIASAYLVAQGHVFVVHSGFSRCLAGAAHGTTFAMSIMLQTVSSLMVHSFLVVSALGRAAHLLLLPLLLLLSLLLFLPYYCHYWLESDVCEHQGFHREQEAFSHIHCPDILSSGSFGHPTGFGLSVDHFLRNTVGHFGAFLSNLGFC